MCRYRDDDVFLQTGMDFSSKSKWGVPYVTYDNGLWQADLERPARREFL